MATRRDVLTTPGASTPGIAAWSASRAGACAHDRPGPLPHHADPDQFVELGRGRVDLPGAFGALSEVGYSGTL
jgi:sugar phosphate isomerase/epimerase